MSNTQPGADPPTNQLIDHWRRLIRGPQKSWVLFARGTCVILMKPEADLGKQATELLLEWGPVRAGSPAGDFSVQSLAAYPGWVVYGHHPDVLNYVAPSEVPSRSDDAAIGLHGRAKRHADGLDPRVIHVEDKRGTT